MTTGYSAGRSVSHNMVTTQFELDGFHVTRTLGVVRGIVVRSRSIFGTIGAGTSNASGRQHHVTDQSLREDPPGGFRPYVATRGRVRSKRGCGRALRCDRDHAGRHGGAGIRHRGVRRAFKVRFRSVRIAGFAGHHIGRIISRRSPCQIGELELRVIASDPDWPQQASCV